MLTPLILLLALAAQNPTRSRYAQEVLRRQGRGRLLQACGLPQARRGRRRPRPREVRRLPEEGLRAEPRDRLPGLRRRLPHRRGRQARPAEGGAALPEGLRRRRAASLRGAGVDVLLRPRGGEAPRARRRALRQGLRRRNRGFLRPARGHVCRRLADAEGRGEGGGPLRQELHGRRRAELRPPRRCCATARHPRDMVKAAALARKNCDAARWRRASGCSAGAAGRRRLPADPKVSLELFTRACDGNEPRGCPGGESRARARRRAGIAREPRESRPSSSRGLRRKGRRERYELALQTARGQGASRRPLAQATASAAARGLHGRRSARLPDPRPVLPVRARRREGL